ncbi:MAG: Flp family type IVb pilin, partial [Asticcacaulis sp.]
MIKLFLKDQRGATAIEYGLIAALIFLVCITVFYSFGDSMNEMYTYIGTTI